MRLMRRVWILPLALFCALALAPALPAAGDGSQVKVTAGKLDPNLSMLADAYRLLGIRRTGERKLSAMDMRSMMKKAMPEARGALLAFYKMTAGDGGHFNPVKRDGTKVSLAGVKNRDGRRQRGLIDPELQKRWGDPAFDVVRASLVTRGDPRRLGSAYMRVGPARQEGDLWKAFCEVALYKAPEIAADGDVVRLEMLPRSELHNDLGTSSTGAPRLRLGQPGRYGLGYTGQGVLVGDVDTGIDWTHGDFLNPDGSTRILYLWDTSDTTPGKTPEDLFGMSGFDIGTVWTKDEIDAGLCTEIDDEAHGTHTIGTAAGNGGATGRYTGMAPNADIIFVKGLYVEGNEFCYEMARRLGRPIAVNNSFGSGSPFYYGAYLGQVNYYPGDGSDTVSQYYDWLASAYPTGAVIGKSAGNNGMWPTYTDHDDYGFALYDGSLHFGGTSTSGGAVEHVYDQKEHAYTPGFGKYYECNDFMIRSDVPVRVTVRVDEAHSYVMDTGSLGEIDAANDFSEDTFYQLVTQDPNNGEYTGIIWLDQFSYWNWGFPTGEWRITVEPLNPGDTAHYDVWAYSEVSWILLPYAYTYYDSCFTANSSHDEYQLDYSASRSVITTGAWTTRSSYQAADGNTYYPWGFLEPALNTITYFSSPGPARDGRMKPDIAAPGAAIISAASKDGGWVTGDLDPDLAHGWMWGTSMAAPHATGAAALVLQKYPGLSLDGVRNRLQRWALNDSYTNAIGANGFGAGKLNVLPLNDPPAAVLVARPGEIVLDEATQAACDGSASRDPEGFPITYSFTLLSQPAGANASVKASGSQATLAVDPGLEGAYRVGLVVNDGIARSEMAVVTVTARFYPVLPPANAQLQRLENDYIFYKEYVNRLTWAANPADMTTVTAYNIYRKDKGADDSVYARLASLPAAVFAYEDRGLASAQFFTYKITSVNSRGKESDPAIVSN